MKKEFKEAKETVGTATPFTPERTGSVDFGQVVKALKEGKRVTCVAWQKENIFIFMQVPSKVDMKIVTKMTSLPQVVKDEFVVRQKDNFDIHNSIRYQNQIAVVYPDNNIYSWTPTVHDILQEDWIILDEAEETYMDRLIIERDELDIKYEKLTKALENKTVPDSAIDILTEQSCYMEDYLSVLNKRIG